MYPLARAAVVEVGPDLGPDRLVQLRRVPRRHGALGQVEQEAPALGHSKLINTFILSQRTTNTAYSQPLNIVRILLLNRLTPRSRSLYIGFENPSACLLTAADSLLSALPMFNYCILICNQKQS